MFTTVRLCVNYQWNKRNLVTKSAEVKKDARSILGEIAIVSGSNSGLGKHAALELARRGAVVIMACRDVKRAEAARNDILETFPDARLEIEAIDFGDLTSVREFAERIKTKYPRIDILVNNAGVFLNSISKTKDGLESSMQINHVGHFLLTMLLLDHMKKPPDSPRSRIVWVSSSMQYYANLDLDDINMENNPDVGFCSFIPYANSKLANALTSRELGKRLQGTGINSYAVCPGLVRTEVFRHEKDLRQQVSEICLFFGGVSIHSVRFVDSHNKGCKTILHCALSKSIENESGQFYRFLDNWDPCLTYYDDAFSERFWKECEKMCGIMPEISKERE